MNVNMLRSAASKTSALEVNLAAQMCAALADPVRLRLFLLVAQSAGETCACDLVGPSGRSQPTVSHHMKVLVDSGLVQRTKRGQWVWYRVDAERVNSLTDLLIRRPNDA
jgi:ArsR family transcriptional regulator